MTQQELISTKAPFKVQSIHDGRLATIIGFQTDPLGVGLPAAFFEGGGWCVVTDLLKHWNIAGPCDKSDLIKTRTELSETLNYYLNSFGETKQWKYRDEERPNGFCYDCRIWYRNFADLSLPNDVWEMINPTNHAGAGLLCPNCICERLRTIGVSGVVATIWPGK